MSKNALSTGEKLNRSESLDNGNYSLLLDTNGNLILKDSNKTIWNSNSTSRGSDCYLVLNPDGNLVIKYTDPARADLEIWSSKTCGGNGKNVLVLGNDGTLGIYTAPYWAVGTKN